MIISVKAKKSIWENPAPFLIKNGQQTRNRGNFLNLINGIYEKPTVNIILKSERLKAFPLSLGKRQRSPLLLNITLEVLARIVKQENK